MSSEAVNCTVVNVCVCECYHVVIGSRVTLSSISPEKTRCCYEAEEVGDGCFVASHTDSYSTYEAILL